MTILFSPFYLLADNLRLCKVHYLAVAGQVLCCWGIGDSCWFEPETEPCLPHGHILTLTLPFACHTNTPHTDKHMCRHTGVHKHTTTHTHTHTPLTTSDMHRVPSLRASLCFEMYTKIQLDEWCVFLCLSVCVGNNTRRKQWKDYVEWRWNVKKNSFRSIIPVHVAIRISQGADLVCECEWVCFFRCSLEF